MKAIILYLKKFFVFKLFIVGVFFAFLIQSAGSCNKDEYNPYASEETVNVDKIDEGVKLVETAFISGNAESIKNILSDDAQKLYGTDLSKINQKDLIKLGEAFKTKKIKVYSDMYAEYEYVKDGITYTFSMARKEDGSWMLMRF